MAKQKDVQPTKDKPAEEPKAPEKVPEATKTDKAPEAPAPASFIPKAYEGTLKVEELPNARALFRTNIRTVRVGKGETPDQAIDRTLGIPALMADIEKSAPGLGRPVQIGEWKQVPGWLEVISREGKIGYQEFTKPDGTKVFRAIIDGNRTVMSIQGLKAKYPTGHKVELRSQDPSTGKVTLTEVSKTYDEVAVQVFPEPSHDAFRALQAVSNNKLEFRRGDIAKMAIELIQNDPIGTSEKVIEAHLGTLNRMRLTKAENFHSMAQELERAALCPADVTSQYVDYLNGEEGVVHPTNADLRDMYPYWKAEVISFAGGKVTMGPLFDAEINPRVMTTEEVCAVWAKWPKGRLAYEIREAKGKGKTILATWARCEHKEPGCDCSTPDQQSEFVKVWSAIKVRPRQSKKGGTKVDQLKMKAYEGGLVSQGAPFTSAYTTSLRGDDQAINADKNVDFMKKFENNAILALKAVERLRLKFPEAFKALSEDMQPAKLDELLTFSALNDEFKKLKAEAVAIAVATKS